MIPAPSVAPVEEDRKTLCNDEELSDMRDDAKRVPLSRNESGSA